MVTRLHVCRHGTSKNIKIFKINIFFKGDDNPDQLRKIAQVMGTADIERYIQKYKLRPDQKAKEYIEEKTWSKRKL